jgi:hypothetical protein
VLLHFGAVDYAAHVWVNGVRVGHHEGAAHAVPLRHDGVLDPSGRQVVTVLAEDDPHDLTKPRGKQDWQLEPHSIWYPRTTGIWQTVWLERVGRTYIDKIRWTPHVEDSRSASRRASSATTRRAEHRASSCATASACSRPTATG